MTIPITSIAQTIQTMTMGQQDPDVASGEKQPKQIDGEDRKGFKSPPAPKSATPFPISQALWERVQKIRNRDIPFQVKRYFIYREYIGEVTSLAKLEGLYRFAIHHKDVGYLLLAIQAAFADTEIDPMVTFVRPIDVRKESKKQGLGAALNDFFKKDPVRIKVEPNRPDMATFFQQAAIALGELNDQYLKKIKRLRRRGSGNNELKKIVQRFRGPSWSTDPAMRTITETNEFFLKDVYSCGVHVPLIAFNGLGNLLIHGHGDHNAMAALWGHMLTSAGMAVHYTAHENGSIRLLVPPQLNDVEKVYRPIEIDPSDPNLTTVPSAQKDARPMDQATAMAFLATTGVNMRGTVNTGALFEDGELIEPYVDDRTRLEGLVMPAHAGVVFRWKRDDPHLKRLHYLNLVYIWKKIGDKIPHDQLRSLITLAPSVGDKETLLEIVESVQKHPNSFAHKQIALLALGLHRVAMYREAFDLSESALADLQDDAPIGNRHLRLTFNSISLSSLRHQGRDREVDAYEAKVHLYVEEEKEAIEREREANASVVESIDSAKAIEKARGNLASGERLIVLYVMPECGPCKEYKPLFNEMARKAPGNDRFIIVPNGDESEYGIEAFPQVVIYSTGDETPLSYGDMWDLKRALEW